VKLNTSNMFVVPESLKNKKKGRQGQGVRVDVVLQEEAKRQGGFLA
jgi:hypothetical protein